MNRDEATRIAGAVNALRPDWGVSGLMTILGNDRLRGRAYGDMARIFLELALDPKSLKPTRVFEQGPWWSAASPRDTSASAAIRRAEATDCSICGHPADRHVVASLNDHDYIPRHANGRGVNKPEGLKP